MSWAAGPVGPTEETSFKVTRPRPRLLMRPVCFVRGHKWSSVSPLYEGPIELAPGITKYKPVLLLKCGRCKYVFVQESEQ